MYLLSQFCSNRVEFFLQYTGDTDAKNDGPEFWNSNSVILENILKFSKRRRAVPLRPIWTIMVAAKLDQSRVLVTKFRQNRLTLKGRSAGQRHTDRQTRLKIRALQICNRANNRIIPIASILSEYLYLLTKYKFGCKTMLREQTRWRHLPLCANRDLRTSFINITCIRLWLRHYLP